MDAVLVNAAFFRGLWKNKFNKDNTKPQIFNGFNKETVDMMKISAELYHGMPEHILLLLLSFEFQNQFNLFSPAKIGKLVADDATYIELPYEDDSISMFVYLPNKNTPTAVDDLLDTFSGESIDDSLKQGRYGPVNVELPRMKMEGDYLLEEVSYLEHT